MKKKCNFIDVLAVILVIIGALNWGLVGIFNFNVVTAIFGDMSIISKIVYIIVGVAGLWMIYGSLKCCRASSCNKSD